MEFFAGATRKGRHPQSFGDGETGRAHAISNVQELATRGKRDEQEGPKREAERQKKQVDGLEVARQKNQKSFRL